MLRHSFGHSLPRKAVPGLQEPWTANLLNMSPISAALQWNSEFNFVGGPFNVLQAVKSGTLSLFWAEATTLVGTRMVFPFLRLLQCSAVNKHAGTVGPRGLAHVAVRTGWEDGCRTLCLRSSPFGAHARPSVVADLQKTGEMLDL